MSKRKSSHPITDPAIKGRSDARDGVRSKKITSVSEYQSFRTFVSIGTGGLVKPSEHKMTGYEKQVYNSNRRDERKIMNKEK